MQLMITMTRSYLLIILWMVSLQACNSFIDVKPESEFTTENFYATEDDIEQAVVGAYDALQAIGEYGQYFVYFMEVRADNSIEESSTSSSGVFAAFDTFSLEASNDVLNTTWTACYDGVNRANTVLGRIDGIDMDEATIEVRKGEMYFLRALTYFNLVRLWDAVPLVVEETTDPIESLNIGRSDATKVMAQVIADLEEAISLLPVTQSESGRATLGAAQMLLAEVYLTQQDYASATTPLDNLIQTGTYVLESDYLDIFSIDNESNEEVVFEVQFASGNDGEGSRLANLFAPIGATELVGNSGTTSGDNMPTQDLYDAYDDDDLRRDASIGVLDDGRFYAQKYISEPDLEYDAENNFVVYRYADALLMQAEALNEVGYQADGDAFTYLNQVRTRAGLTAWDATDLPDQDAFRDAVYQERRLELAFENHRWFDLIRTGLAVEVLDGHEATEGAVSVSDYQLIYPIPQTQIDIMNDTELMWQNPGY